MSGASAALPQPRNELRLLAADPNRDGSPAWLIQDPVCNRFYRIGWLDFEMLVRWQRGTPAAITEGVNTETPLHVDEHDVQSLQRFLDSHDLLQRAGAEAVEQLKRREQAQRKGVLAWLLHHYLFIRIPLVRPQDALARLAHALRWLFTPEALAVVAGMGLAGLMLVAHQWDAFTGTFAERLTLESAVGFALALAVAKMVHEMGHALTATIHGVRVAHMGVALVVMFPMLYTDTSESWKLTRPRQRLAIASAGILSELALAGVATLAWSFAPDGLVREAAFYLATTSWILTLAVNASPFMRFDGYFIACDALNLPNLHERAGAMARTWLRRNLLGFADAWPEEMPHGLRRALIAFAVATWVYRLFLFLGIAVVVYLFAFKLLGIALMAVEVGWFIVRPLAAEAGLWWKRRGEVVGVRRAFFLVFFVGAALVLVLPWRGLVHAPGVVHAAYQQSLFSPHAGQIVSMPGSGLVAAGHVLYVVTAPDLKTSQQRSQALAAARSRELLGLNGMSGGEERRAVVQSERDRFIAEAGVFEAEMGRMHLAAAFRGRVVDVDPQLKPGVWVQPHQPLGVLIDDTSWTADVLVAEEDVARVRIGDGARIYVGGRSLEPMEGTVVDIDSSRTVALPFPMLDSAAGGSVVTLPPRPGDRTGERTVRDGLFRVRIAVKGVVAQGQMLPCTVAIAAKARSLLEGVFARAASVLVRESGF